MGFLSVLTLIFITLKLTGHILWSWIWVLSPLWISFVVGFICIIGLGIINYFENRGESKWD